MSHLHGRFTLDSGGLLAQNARELQIFNVHLHIFQGHHSRRQEVRLIDDVDGHLHAFLQQHKTNPGVSF